MRKTARALGASGVEDRLARRPTSSRARSRGRSPAATDRRAAVSVRSPSLDELDEPPLQRRRGPGGRGGRSPGSAARCRRRDGRRATCRRRRGGRAGGGRRRRAANSRTASDRASGRSGYQSRAGRGPGRGRGRSPGSSSRSTGVTVDDDVGLGRRELGDDPAGPRQRARQLVRRPDGLELDGSPSRRRRPSRCPGARPRRPGHDAGRRRRRSPRRRRCAAR